MVCACFGSRDILVLSAARLVGWIFRFRWQKARTRQHFHHKCKVDYYIVEKQKAGGGKLFNFACCGSNCRIMQAIAMQEGCLIALLACEIKYG